MAFYWGQGVGLPRIPPAFLLHPNTLKGLILCNFRFMCCFSIVPSGKPRQISPFSFSQSHSVDYKSTKARELRLQTGQKLSRAKKQRETGREKYPQSFKVQRVSFAGADKGHLQLFKCPRILHFYILLGNTGNNKEFVYSDFNFSAKAKALFIVSFA